MDESIMVLCLVLGVFVAFLFFFVCCTFCCNKIMQKNIESTPTGIFNINASQRSSVSGGRVAIAMSTLTSITCNTSSGGFGHACDGWGAGGGVVGAVEVVVDFE
ncbi:hypothetical protein P3S68_022552 [Capsicum galapagoense]